MTPLDRIIGYFEALNPDAVGRIGDFYTEDAWFKDPFNEVSGIEAIRHIFAHMFEQVNEPRFRILESWGDEKGAMLTWEFTFRMKSWRRGETQLVRGATHLRFAPDGRVHYHRDYWDAAEELYAKLPLLGGLMRFLRRRARA